MYKIQTPMYEATLTRCYKSRQPLFVCGGPGIGKSAIPRQVFMKIAEQEKKIFAEWADLNIPQKKACIADPDKYWIFADMRTSQMDTTSLTGIPNMANVEMLENIPYSWVVYFTHAKAHGCIFFDEINLAAPIVQSITYSAIHDRVISDRRLSDNVYVFAAGNRSQDKAHTFDMPLPLRDRFAECEIDIDPDHWIKWAQSAGINPHLIAFISWKPENLYNADRVSNQKPCTPRGVERASKLLGDLAITAKQSGKNADNSTHLIVSMSCGESFASEFEAYCKVHSKLNWTEMMRDPSCVSELSLDQEYAVSAGIADQYKRTSDLKIKARLFDIADHLREDFAVFSYRMVATSDVKSLIKDMEKLGRKTTFSNKYAQFLIENV